MYKVVTHTIKEEHFTHPVTVEYVLSMKDSNIRVKSPSTITANDNSITTHEPTILSIKDNFRLTVRNSMEKYVYALRNVIVSIFNSGEDLPVLTEELQKSIDDFINGLNTIYGQVIDSASISLFKQHLTKYTNTIVDLARAHKNNKSTADLDQLLTQQTDDLINLLFNFNTRDWTKSALYNYFNKFSESFKDQIVARKNKEWEKDQEYFKNAYGIFIEGIPDTLSSFAIYLADGFINQFPWAIGIVNN